MPESPCKRPKVGGNEWIVMGYEGFVGRLSVTALRRCKHHVYGLPKDLELLTRALKDRPIAGLVNCCGSDPDWLAQLANVLNGHRCALVHVNIALNLTGAPRWIQPTPSLIKGEGESVTVLNVVHICGVNQDTVLEEWIQSVLVGKQPTVPYSPTDELWLVSSSDFEGCLASVCSQPQPGFCAYELTGPKPTPISELMSAAGMTAAYCAEESQEQRVNGESTRDSESVVDAVSAGLIGHWSEINAAQLVAASRLAGQVVSAHPLKQLHTVDGPRGRMAELFDNQPARVYEIVIEPGWVRGGHYHKEQTEEFYTSSGDVSFEMSSPEDQTIKVYQKLSAEPRKSIRVPPGYIHTVWNPSPSVPAVMIISSTQAYLPNSVPDTYYVN